MRVTNRTKTAVTCIRLSHCNILHGIRLIAQRAGNQITRCKSHDN